MRQLAAFRAFAASLVAALVVLPLSAAHAQVFSNTTPITIPDQGAATPYPSTITVAGFVGTPNGLRVRLRGFTHTVPEDVAVLLVAPNGQGIELLSRSGGAAAASNLTLTFGAESATPLPTSLVPGTFRPAGGNAVSRPPANGIPRAALLGDLIVGSPNGQWHLFVVDVFDALEGTISGGWELEFGNFGTLLSTPSSPSTFTYQGRLDGGAATSTINARFSLWSHPSTGNLGNRLAETVTVNGIAVTDDLFTTRVNPGVPVPADIQTWLQVEVSSPAGAPFVTLTPRQPLTATPLAGAAQRALLADFATNATNSTNAISAISATTAANVASGGFGVGSLIGPAGFIGANQHDLANRNVKSRVGYSIVPTGLAEFAGMITSVGAGTNGGGNSADVTFHTWEFNTSISREIMRINGRGNVGIGTATPSQRLTVSGNVLANNVAVPSSGRFKHNVLPMGDALEKLLQLDGVTFDWNADFAKDRPGREHDIGFVAEDVAKVFPEVVFYDADGNVTGMDYSRLTAVAVAAIKQQQSKFDAELANRDAENAKLKARLEAIEAVLLKMNTDHK